MYFLIYASSAKKSFTTEELVSLLALARQRNHAAGITGLLLFKDGNFMQVLEGDKQSVTATYNKIQQDSRHSGVIKLLDGELSDRLFPDWSMALKDLDNEDVRQLPGFSEFLNSKLSADEFFGNPGRCMVLLEIFKKNMR